MPEEIKENYTWPVLKIFMIIISLIAIYGFFVPALITAANTVSVVVGISIGIFPIVYGVIHIVNFLANNK